MARSLHLLPAVMVIAALATACAPGSSVTIGRQGGSPAHEEHAGRPGPPPHAPAHGYRQKYHASHDRDVELVFDSKLGVYVVLEFPDVYFCDGYFLKIDGGRWYSSVEIDRGWEPRNLRSLPPGLQKKHAKHNKHRKSAPAKGRW